MESVDDALYGFGEPADAWLAGLLAPTRLRAFVWPAGWDRAAVVELDVELKANPLPEPELELEPEPPELPPPALPPPMTVEPRIAWLP